jgi:uncharacterized membrane-anchored protein YhcB (DUF1043 family)
VATNYNEWVIYALVFLLGLVIGMALMAGGKWKRRYKEEHKLRLEEVRRREVLEKEHETLRGRSTEMDSLRHSAARDEARRHPEDSLRHSDGDRRHPNDDRGPGPL